MQNNPALRRRIAPAVPLSLEMVNDDGTKFGVSLKLSFDFNATSALEEKTGLPLVLSIWENINSPKIFSAMVWSACLTHQPDYDSEEGLEVIRSYMDGSNVVLVRDALWKAYLLYLPPEVREELPATFSELLKKLEAKKNANGEAPGNERPFVPKSDSAGSSSGPSPATTSDSPTMSSVA